MKKSVFPALLLAWTITQAVAVPETYEINPENSSVLFKVRLLWTTNIEGCFCGGVSGRVSFDPDAPQKSTVKARNQNRNVKRRCSAAKQRDQRPGVSGRGKVSDYHFQEHVDPKGQRPTVHLDWRVNLPWGHETTDGSVQPRWPE